MFVTGGLLMDIAKYPHYQLYSLTLHLLMLKDQLVPDSCENRCIDSTIINRAYFSSYLFCGLWLEDVKKFKPTPLEMMNIEERISEHLQIRNALYFVFTFILFYFCIVIFILNHQTTEIIKRFF